jgi:hypothetical protein
MFSGFCWIERLIRLLANAPELRVAPDASCRAEVFVAVRTNKHAHANRNPNTSATSSHRNGPDISRRSNDANSRHMAKRQPTFLAVMRSISVNRQIGRARSKIMKRFRNGLVLALVLSQLVPQSQAVSQESSFAVVEPEAATDKSPENDPRQEELVSRRGCLHGGSCPHSHDCDFTVSKHAQVAHGKQCVDHPGDIIRYTAIVSNTGSSPLTVVTAHDSIVQLYGPPLPRTLPPGATLTYTGQYTVQPQDLHFNCITNTVAVITKEAGSRAASAKVAVCGEGPCDYAFEVHKGAKIADGGMAIDQAGELIYYTVAVANTGNRPVTLESVYDSLVALVPSTPLPTVLPVGAEVTFAGTYKVQPGDLHLGAIVNKVTARTREAGAKTDSVAVPVGKADCTECGCKKCCKWVLEEYVEKCPQKVRKCYTVHECEERTVPYCCKKCEDGKCVEVLGTKTVRQFVQRKKVETKVDEVPEIRCHWVHKCLKCGVMIGDCPDIPCKTTTASAEALRAFAFNEDPPSHTDTAPPAPSSAREPTITQESTFDAPETTTSSADPSSEPVAAEDTRPEPASTDSPPDAPTPSTGKVRQVAWRKLLQELLPTPPDETPIQHSAVPHCEGCPAADATGSITPQEPDWSLLTGHGDLLNCEKCACDKCCVQVVDEYLKPQIKKVRVCVKVYEPEECTNAYCDVKCKHGECLEVVGTKTLRRFVPRYKEVDVELLKWIIDKKPVEKCLKCGYKVDDCPSPDEQPQSLGPTP